MVRAVSPPRFGVIGGGSIGKRHVKNLLALGERDVFAFDPREDRRAELVALGVNAVAEVAALWDVKPTAVLVTAPTRMHVSLATEAAKQGCHVFIEKPVAEVHDAELDALCELVREKKLVTLVGCNLRFHPSLLGIKKLLAENQIGRVVSIRAEFGAWLPDWHPWEDYRQGYSARRDLGGGVVLDAIHEIDYARWLMGEVEVVSAFAAKLSDLEIDTEDTASIVLRFASGAFGEIHLDYVQRIASRTCTIIGDRGTLTCDLRQHDGIRAFDAATKQWQTFPTRAGWELNQMYVDEMKHFLACVRGEETPTQDVLEGARVLDVALAVKASSEKGELVRPASMGGRQ